MVEFSDEVRCLSESLNLVDDAPFLVVQPFHTVVDRQFEVDEDVFFVVTRASGEVTHECEAGVCHLAEPFFGYLLST